MIKYSAVPLVLFGIARTCFPLQAAELDKQSAEIESVSRSRGVRIERELRRDSAKRSDWSGKYFKGDGTGENIDLWVAPRGGFFFQWTGCLGVYDRNYGKVESVHGMVRLQCELPNKPGEGFEGTPTEFLPLHWGERHYLIPTSEIVDFCNAVNAHEEPRSRSFGSFLLREDDWERAAKGAPSLPTPYVRFLLSMPIVMRIAEVPTPKALSPHGKPSKSWRTTRVFVGLGTADGLLPGMELHVIDPDLVYSAKVVRAGKHSAEADFVQYVGDGLEDSPPKVGWKLSTRPKYR